jgi:3-hydroxyisobutyrate dehydrogenase-like beta-hydroxyacid dehydrogenase
VTSTRQGSQEEHLVTVLGLGAMGSALAAALTKQGHPTTVWNRSAERADGLVARGARRATIVEEAVAASPLTIACVLDDAALGEVLDLAGEALAGRFLVNLTSTTPEQARRAAARAADAGVAGYLDGGILAVPPLIGTPEALILYSGSSEAFATNRPVLENLGSARYLGADPGTAALYDVALLTGMYGMFGGVLHAIAIAATEDVRATDIMELLVPWLDAMGGSLPQLAEQVDADDHPTDSPLAMQARALASLVEASRAQGVRADLLVPMQRLVDDGVAAGHGDKDLSSLVQLLAQGSTEPVASED